MALILNIETASPVCSVCLAKDETIIDFREDKTGNSHAKILTVFIDELFKSNSILISELDAVAVSAGPGSYTGLRIGTSVAKGLCYALNKPLIAVPTLLALAKGIQQKQKDTSGFYMPVLDARRMDVYTAIYDSELNIVVETRCVTLNQQFESSIAQLNKVHIGGNATVKCQQLLKGDNLVYTEGVVCGSRSMVSASHYKYMLGGFENVAYFEPVYLKEFSAQSKNP